MYKMFAYILIKFVIRRCFGSKPEMERLERIQFFLKSI